ncbi:hypothetical protein lerEdw1_011092 [Lerista edwardsae]|nr:hypothetical protein lerEdw1_011092 [Lerista edwardsae]
MDLFFMKQSWDEWVPESRVLKYVDTNLQKQKELQKANQEQYAEGKMRGAAPGKKTSGLQQKNVEVLTLVPWSDGQNTQTCKSRSMGLQNSTERLTCILLKAPCIGSDTLSLTRPSLCLDFSDEMEPMQFAVWRPLQYRRVVAGVLIDSQTLHVEQVILQEGQDLGEVECQRSAGLALGIGEGSSTSENPQPPRKKRARVDPTVESEETFMNRVEVKVKIPEELKPWLVDDWDLITRQKQLFYLPAKKNVDSILEDYANYKKSRGNTDNKEYAVNEVVAGIKEYFNVMLGTQLLYKFERPQYAEILADHPDAPMSQVYGAPHLLRLFVRIGAMLAYTPLDEKSLALLLNYLHDFLKYLAKNSSALFSASDYEVAPPEYHRKAV